MEHEAWIDLIAKEVIKRLQHPEKPADAKQSVLALFTGGSIGLSQGLEQIKMLQAMQVAVTVVLSRPAEEIIGVEKIKECLGAAVPILTAADPYPKRLLQGVDAVVVPVLTQNTAAKVAATIADSLPSTLLMQGLMMGKPIIAAVNAADPKDKARTAVHMDHTSPALLTVLQDNLSKLERYGIELVAVEQLAVQCQRAITKKIEPVAVPTPAPANGRREIIDAAAVKAAVSQGLTTLQVPAKAIVTPLARDVARDTGITIIQA